VLAAETFTNFRRDNELVFVVFILVYFIPLNIRNLCLKKTAAGSSPTAVLSF
jgi:hypothetical protein